MVFSLNTKNMHQAFYIEYFRGLEDVQGTTIAFKERNAALIDFSFDLRVSPVSEWQKLPGYKNINLKTTYPGMLIGTGYPHDLAGLGSLKQGFSFDYVTGLPTVPGSSLKGILRSGFPLSVEELAANKEAEYSALESANQMKFEYVRSILGDMTDQEIMELRDLIFGEFDWTDKETEDFAYQPSDVFLGGFPRAQKNEMKLLELEYITPHDKEGFKNPIPIPLLKVKPDIVFEFGFILRDTVLKNGKTISVAKKVTLFTQILEDFGVGAKTNVGFGQLVRA